MERQIRIEGYIEPVSEKDADAYFAKQPREHQVRAWVSDQSRTLQSLSALKSAVIHHTQEFGILRIPRPPSWAAYRVHPNLIEFWQSGRFGIDQRDCYTCEASGLWKHRQLSP